MKNRRRGTGSIEPTADGRFRPRLPGQGARLSPCATEEEAAILLDATLQLLAAGDYDLDRGPRTLAKFGLDVLDERELAGVRGVASERSRWKTHVLGTDLAAKALSAIVRADVVGWRDAVMKKRVTKGRHYKEAPDRRVARSTVLNSLSLIRIVLGVALERDLIASNPARDVKLPRDKGRVREPWTYLMPEEQTALLTCAAIPIERRLLIALAMGTGLREGELYNLELGDVGKDEVVVRFGSNGKPTKSGKIRRVPLFGIAGDALARWRPLLAKQENDCRLLVPLPCGSRRQKGAPKWWPKALELAGIIPERRHDRQPVRWHDLRHTCGSSLVAGWWGRRWSLEEVRELLGHSTIKMTERYAHLAHSVIAAAGRGTIGPKFGDRDLPSLGRSQSRKPEPLSRLELETYGLRKSANDLEDRDLGAVIGKIEGLGERAIAALEAIAAGGADAYRVPIEVLGELAALSASLRATKAVSEVAS